MKLTRFTEAQIVEILAQASRDDVTAPTSAGSTASWGTHCKVKAPLQ